MNHIEVLNQSVYYCKAQISLQIINLAIKLPYELRKAERKEAPTYVLARSPFSEPIPGMEGFMPQNIVKLDGRVGEGGGQVVRIAVALAALTRTPLCIEHVRGNRYSLPSTRGYSILIVIKTWQTWGRPQGSAFFSY